MFYYTSHTYLVTGTILYGAMGNDDCEIKKMHNKKFVHVF